MTTAAAITLTSTRSDELTVFEVTGVLDVACAARLESDIGRELQADRTVVVDLSGVSICDSTGLGALVRLHRRACAAGATFALRAPRRQVSDVLAMTGISDVIVVLPAQALPGSARPAHRTATTHASSSPG
jgi:anti-sigma B factor antagonist